MGSARLQNELYQGPVPCPLHHPVAGGRRLAGRVHLPHNQGSGYPPDRGLHPALFRLRHPVAHRQIDPPEGPGVHLTFQFLLGVGMLGHHQQSRSTFIQPVDRVDPRRFPLLLVIISDIVAQGIPAVAWSRMNRYTGGLVDHQQVLVLIDHIHRPRRGGHSLRPLRIVHPHRENLSRRCPLAGDSPDAIQQDAVLQPFDPFDHST